MKINKIIYWVSTSLASAGMLMSSFMYLTQNPKMLEAYKLIGFPIYFMTILGTAKLLGAFALLQQKFAKLKEWAYAGFTFTMIGAIWTHLATSTHSPLNPFVFLLILAVSYVYNIRLRKTASALNK